MGRSESASTHIGLRFRWCDLEKLVCPGNVSDVVSALRRNLYVADDNGCFNEHMGTVDDDVARTMDGMRAFTAFLKTHGDINLYRAGLFQTRRDEVEFEVYSPDSECLYNRDFIYATEDSRLVECERWGYDRSGTNAACEPLDLADIEAKALALEATCTRWGLSQHARRCSRAIEHFFHSSPPRRGEECTPEGHLRVVKRRDTQCLCARQRSRRRRKILRRPRRPGRRRRRVRRENTQFPNTRGVDTPPAETGCDPTRR